MDRTRTGILLVLFFLSGAAALIYEVLWLKELGLLFGVTSYAAATTLAVFFLGLSVGSLVWGRRARGLVNPLRAYALLELGIALSALLYFWLLDAYYFIYPTLFEAVGDQRLPSLAAKFFLAVGILFLPAFFMGGTLPVMGEYLIRRPEDLGRKASALYAINTFGAAAGALAAGFYLPRWLGYRRSYGLAVALNLFVFLVASWWSRREASSVSPARSVPEPGASDSAASSSLGQRTILLLAFCSGFLTLALEVLWTRMFSQVLQNSVYTFAAILTVFLLALALGSVLANFLCRIGSRPLHSLFSLLIAAGLAVALTPYAFYRLTSGMDYFGRGLGWLSYSLAVFALVAFVLLVPGLLIGSVLPYLMKHSERWMKSAGWTIGKLSGVNTVAAILGSLTAGFLLLDRFGLWSSLHLVAAGYFVLALTVVASRAKSKISRLAWIPAAGLGLLVAADIDSRLSTVRLEEGEELVWSREGAHGTVAVIQQGRNLRMKVNNHYRLGSAASALNQRFQAWLPLSLHPAPRSVFFLGMGTGITAGGALDFPLESIVVTELSPDVVTAAERYFSPYLNGLLEDPRVELISEDGRLVLAGSSAQYDVIIADIFLTHRAGVGSLYTKEHFEIVRSRLRTGGLYAHWVPMMDWSSREFGIVARTMLEVFPEVSLWRRNMSPEYPIFALVATVDSTPLDAPAFRARMASLAEKPEVPDKVFFSNIPFATLVGPLSAMREDFGSFPVSTDDRRPLEYIAPITEKGGSTRQPVDRLQGEVLADFCAELLAHSAPMVDNPYLSRLSQRDFREIAAGLEFFRYETSRRLGDARAARQARRRYFELLAAEPPAEAAVEEN